MLLRRNKIREYGISGFFARIYVSGNGDANTWTRLSLLNEDNGDGWTLDHQKADGELKFSKNGVGHFWMNQGLVAGERTGSLHINRNWRNGESRLRTVLNVGRKDQAGEIQFHPYDMQNNCGMEIISGGDNRASLDFLEGGNLRGRLLWQGGRGLIIDSNGDGSADAITNASGEFSISGNDTCSQSDYEAIEFKLDFEFLT